MPPIIDLYTMGPGDDVFSRFGHAALCVSDDESPAGRCYNYGTTDFNTPLPLTWDFLRGRARFWVAVQDLPLMLASYTRQDRTVFRQRLALPPATAQTLAVALEDATAEDVRYYHYHHFKDNCTTRLRDHLEAVLPGALRSGNEAPTGPSYRDFARAGFAGDVPLQIVAELVLGRGGDQRTSRWQAMFLPEVLKEEVRARLHAPAEVLHQRAPHPQGPLQRSQILGRLALVLTGLGMAIAVRRWPKARLLRGLSSGLLGLVALVLWGLAAVTAFPELRANENLLLLWPSDGLLVALPPRWQRRYLALRLCGLLLCAALSVIGLLHQPLLAPLCFVGLPLLAIYWYI